MQTPLHSLRGFGLILVALGLSLTATQSAELNLAAARPDLSVKLRFEPGNLTSSAAENVRFYVDVTNVGSSKFIATKGSILVVSTVNGNGVEFPKKTFRLRSMAVGQKVTFQYNHNDLWPVEHCFAAFVRAEVKADEINPRNSRAQITGQSVSDAIAALLSKNKFKFLGS